MRLSHYLKADISIVHCIYVCCIEEGIICNPQLIDEVN